MYYVLVCIIYIVCFLGTFFGRWDFLVPVHACSADTSAFYTNLSGSNVPHSSYLPLLPHPCASRVTGPGSCTETTRFSRKALVLGLLDPIEGLKEFFEPLRSCHVFGPVTSCLPKVKPLRPWAWCCCGGCTYVFCPQAWGAVERGRNPISFGQKVIIWWQSGIVISGGKW